MHHAFRPNHMNGRVIVTWCQEVGGSAIEASKIAGHGDLEMIGDDMFVTAARQNELTRRIQVKLRNAGKPAVITLSEGVLQADPYQP